MNLYRKWWIWSQFVLTHFKLLPTGTLCVSLFIVLNFFKYFYLGDGDDEDENASSNNYGDELTNSSRVARNERSHLIVWQVAGVTEWTKPPWRKNTQCHCLPFLLMTLKYSAQFYGDPLHRKHCLVHWWGASGDVGVVYLHSAGNLFLSNQTERLYHLCSLSLYLANLLAAFVTAYKNHYTLAW